MGEFGKPVFFDQGEDGRFHGCQDGRDAQYGAAAAVFQFLFAKGMRKDGQEHAVQAYGRLDHIGDVVLPEFRIEVLQLFAGELFMAREVEIRSGMDPLQFLEPEGKPEFDICRCICVMRQFLVIVEAVLFGPHPQGQVPFHAGLLPVLIPFLLLPGPDKKLHFHLLEFPHPEDKLTGDDLVAKRLADLGDPEGDLHPPRFLYVQEIHKDPLGGFRPEVEFHGRVCRGPQAGAEHQVELLYIRPVAGPGNRANDLQLFNQGPDIRQVFRLEGTRHPA